MLALYENLLCKMCKLGTQDQKSDYEFLKGNKLILASILNWEWVYSSDTWHTYNLT